MERSPRPRLHKQKATAQIPSGTRHVGTYYSIFGWPNGIAIWGLFLTLTAIVEQTRETRKAAEAARDNVNIFVQKERARLVVELVPTETGIRENIWEIGFRVVNLGLSRAFDIILTADYRITNTLEQPVPFNGAAQGMPNTLKTDDPWYGAVFLFPAGIGEEDVVKQIESELMYVHAYGVLFYKDAFCAGSEVRTVEFHYRWNHRTEEEFAVDENGYDAPKTVDVSSWIPVFYKST